MAYDIPPPLQHKERIIFRLTLFQLAIAAPSLLIIIFLLKFLPIEAVIPIGTLIIAAASFFMFFDGLHKTKSLVGHLRHQEMELLSDDLKRIVDVKKVDDIIELSKNKLAILEVIPMNFMLKTNEEQESILLSFEKFLNSLDFPIQIHITSNPIHLGEHFTYTHKQVKKQGEQYKPLLDSYCQFIRQSIQTNNIQNRNFYIIIPEKDTLSMQIRICQEGIDKLGLKVRKLTKEDTVTFFHSYIAHNKKKELKKEQTNDVAHFLYAPEKIKFMPDHFKVNDLFCKVIQVTGYPHSVEMGFLDKIISSGEKYDISVHIEPFPIEHTMIQLNRELQKQQSDLYADSKKGIINPSLDIKFKSTKKVLEDLQKGKQKLFNVSLYIMCKGKSLQEVNLLAKKVKAGLDGLMIQSKTPLFEMMAAYESMLPLGKNKLNAKRNIHTKGLSAFFPFSSPFLDIDTDGVLLGLNKNKIPYIKNIFHLANANGVILATSGSGKSYFTKLLISRQFMNGCDVIIIDPQGEYLAITEQYKGETITISKDSKTIINPLDLMGHEYLEKRLSLIDLFGIMFGDINELQKSILDRAIDMTYEDKGIDRDNYDASEPPILSDLYAMLEKLMKSVPKQEEVTYRALLNRLHMYTSKGVFGFLDRQTRINFDNKFVCFNIGNMPKQVKPVVMYLVLDHVYMKMKESSNRKLLVIDEAWSMLQTAEESSYVFEIVKTCRKYNLGLLMITQDVADLVGSKAGHAVLANTSYTFLLRQKPAVISNVARTFNLSQNERDFLVSASLGNGILILENEHQELEVIASPEEHKLITTNPDEMIKLSEKKEPPKDTSKEKESANLDLTQLIYPAKGLTVLQVNVLANHGYVMKKGHGLTSGPHTYYVKQKHNESLEHTLLVGLIVDELKKYTEEVSVYTTKKPDIVFKNKVGQEIVLEIETGKGLKKHRGRTDEKFAAAKKKYRDRVYIVLTDKDKRNSYARYEIPMLLKKDMGEFIRLQFSGQMNSVIGANSKGRKFK